MKKIFHVDEKDADIRLDIYLSNKLPEISRTAIGGYIKSGDVICNDKPSKASYKVNPGDIIIIAIPEPEKTNIRGENIPIDIVYEDDWLAVVNKPRGMVVHPAPGHREGTLVNALIHKYKNELSDVNGKLRPGIVHRIDKDTTGLILVIKRNEAHLKLAEDISEHKVERIYYAICCGVISENTGLIDLPIGRDPKNRQKNSVHPEGKPAVTYFDVLERFPSFTLLRLRLKTGRTHQIRVHLSHIGHPILGDRLYGGIRKKIPTDGQMLHAGHLRFNHPVLNRDIIVETPLPEDFLRILSELRAGTIS